MNAQSVPDPNSPDALDQGVRALSPAPQLELPARAPFETPMVAGLAQPIEAEREAAAGVWAGGSEPSPRPAGLPLSFSQQRLWFVDQLEPQSAIYNIALAMRLAGRLDVAVLERCLSEIVRRHTVLRTTFASEAGQPVQRVNPAPLLTLPVRDLPWRADAEREQALGRRMAAAAQQPFDLSRDLMLRAELLRLGEQEHVLLVTLNHIAADGWSLDVLLRELAALYPAFAAGQPSPLEELPLQYADYAVWQREQWHGARREQQLAYWKQRLAGALSGLELPVDFPRPAVPTYRGGQESLVLSQDLTLALERLGRAEGATPFMTLLAAFNVLLARWTGRDDIVLGSPIAGRTRAETEPLIGCFLNTLALRTDLSGNPSFRELLGRVRDVTLGAYANQDLPFDELIEELRPDRQGDRNPLFDVLLNYFSTASPPVDLPGLSLERLEVPETLSKFPMTLYVEEQAGWLGLKLVYQAELFSAARMRFLLDQFQCLLEQIIAAPDLPIRRYSLVTPQSRPLLPDPTAVLAEPEQEPVPRSFARWAGQNPAHPAVSQGDRTWSYGELAERAETLARELLASGLQPGDVVAVSGDKSFGLIASLLGVLSSGGVLLPIDRLLPDQRKQIMLREAAATWAILVGDASCGEGWLDETAGRDALIVDGESGRLVGRDRAGDLPGAPLPRLDAGGPAYVFFTSGTTGKPKGILGSHKGLSHFLRWQREEFRVQPADRVAQLTSISFDMVLRDIFLPLTSGATLCLPESHAELDPEALLGWLDRQRISILHIVPARARSWLEHVPPGVTLRALRVVFFAGEPLADTLLNRWRAEFPGSGELVNLYGPTETTLVKCFARIGAAVLPGIQAVGWPLPQTQALVLTEDRELCGIGELGEIVIRTPFCSLGYINVPEQTGFAPNPFRADASDQVYYTGDLGRFRPDGTLEVLGRRDDQVKIRGVRVEPAEVTAALQRHPAVSDCVVVPVVDKRQETRLAAYVVPARDDADTARQLRFHLGEQLPPAMVPAYFVFLDKLPLTPNGKIDRRALPPPKTGLPDTGHAAVAPRNPLEELLAGIWAEVLGWQRVGIDDNFFELGGHSLLATRVVARVRDAVQVELPVRALFERPTIAGLAERIEAARGIHPGALAPAIRAVARDGELPLSFAQQRLWFLDQLQPNNAVYNIPCALQLLGPLDVPALERSLNEIVRRHEVLRTTFRGDGGPPAQRVAATASVALSLADLSGLPTAERDGELERRLVAAAARPYDLSRDLPLRAELLRLDEREHVLGLTIHHIAADAWSLGILLQELATLYGAFVRGDPPPLAELTVQYADYAVWQRESLQAARLDELLRYWKRQLAGAPPALALPTDFPRPAVQTHRGARQTWTADPNLAKSLVRLSRQEGTTPFMVLLAALQTLLSRYTGQCDIVVGAPIAGRIRAEIEPLIGFFVNTLALRTDLSGNPTFRELLGRVREVTLGAYAHQELPFERLVQELQPDRDLSHAPLFQVVLALQNAPRCEVQMPGLEVRAREVHNGTSKFDLVLSLYATEESLGGTLEYNTELFAAGTIARLLGHWERLLAGIVADPSRRLSELPLLTAEERQRVIVQWNQTQTDYPRDRTVHALFEEQADRTPDAVAVVFAGQPVTYRQLNARANQLAHYLRRRGVGPETLVGICVERSLEMVVGLLGILKAGGAYVPLDPAYPQDRLAFLLADAQVPVLLTQQPVLAGLPEHRAQTIRLDLDWRAIARESEENPDPTVSAENLAYVIYTSGTTGVPKGVCIPHRGVVRLVRPARCWEPSSAAESASGSAALPCGSRPGEERENAAVASSEVFGGQEVFLQLASLAFDAATFEIWGCLLNGARLVVFPPHLPSLEELGQTLQRDGITTLWLTAGLFHEMVDHQLERMRGVRQLLAGGDVLSVPHVQKALRELPGCTLINGYGPTENTTFSCCYAMRDARQVGPSVSIGRPIANTEAYVLDRHLEPVPIGVPGELYLGGDGLARGYLNRPELTAEKFLPHPFRNDSRARLYRTGDQVRWLPDGNLEFLGRLDHQVKVRGFRVEPGEVEAALAQHPGLRQSVVVARPDARGHKRLIAYAVPADPQCPPNGEQLRAFLKQKLPEYMLPSAFSLLEQLPLTPHGKVDTRALPGVTLEQTGRRRRYMAPWDPSQHLLKQIWEGLLDARPIGIRDDFFELGGHSLLALTMLGRVEQVCGRRIPVATLFADPTIEALARALLEGEAGQAESPLVEVQAGAGGPPFFYWHGDFNGGGFYCRSLARHLGADQAFYALHPHGLAGQRIPATIEAMAAEHLALVRARQPQGPYRLGGHCNGALVAFEVAQRLRAAGQVVEILAMVAPPLPRRISVSLVLYAGLRRLLRLSFPLLDIPFVARRIPIARRLALLWLYAAACRSYAAQFYPGRVTLLQPDRGKDSPNHPARGWQDLIQDLDTHLLPGGHGSALIQHVHVVAERLRESLSRRA